MPISREEFDSRYGGIANAPAQETQPRKYGWGDRFGASVDSAQAQLLGVGEALGFDTARARRLNQIDSEYVRGRSIQDTGAPQRVTDINSGSSLLKGVAGLAIDSAPMLATSLAAGMGGGALGLGTVGRLALAGAANAPINLGDILQNQREEAGQTDLPSALALTVPYTAADMLGLDAALASGKLARTGIRALDEMKGLRGGLARTGANALMNAPIEGGSETVQEFANQAGRIAVNPDQTMFNPDANERYTESFLGGALLGGAASGVMGGWRRSENYKPTETPRNPDTTPDPDQTGDEWTTQRGLEGVPQSRGGLVLRDKDGNPRLAFDPALGDTTPDWSTTQGFSPAPEALDAEGLWGDHTERSLLNNVKLAQDAGVTDRPRTSNTTAFDAANTVPFTPDTMVAESTGGVAGNGGIGGREGQGSYMSETDMMNDPGAVAARAAQAQQAQQVARLEQENAQRQERIANERKDATRFGVIKKSAVEALAKLAAHVVPDAQPGKLFEYIAALDPASKEARVFKENLEMLMRGNASRVTKWIDGDKATTEAIQTSDAAQAANDIEAARRNAGARNVSNANAAGPVAPGAAQPAGAVIGGSPGVPGPVPASPAGRDAAGAGADVARSEQDLAVRDGGVGAAPVAAPAKPAAPPKPNRPQPGTPEFDMTPQSGTLGAKLVSQLEKSLGRKLSKLERIRTFLAAGIDRDGNAGGDVLVDDEIAAAEVALLGSKKAPVGRTAINNTLSRVGVSKTVLEKFAKLAEEEQAQREIGTHDVVESADGDTGVDQRDRGEITTADEFGETENAGSFDDGFGRLDAVMAEQEYMGDPGDVDSDYDPDMLQSSGYQVKDGSNTGGTGRTGKDIMARLELLTDPKLVDDAGKPVFTEAQRKALVTPLVMHRNADTPAGWRAAQAAANALPSNPVFTEAQQEQLQALVGSTKSNNLRERNISTAMRSLEEAWALEGEQAARNAEITARNEALLDSVEAEVEAPKLRDLIDPKIDSVTIADAAKEWDGDKRTGDTAWVQLTALQQADWVGAWVAYETGDLNAQQLNREYDRQLDATRRGVQQKDGAAGADTRGAAGRTGEQVSEGVRTGEVGKNKPVGPGTAGEESRPAGATEAQVEGRPNAAVPVTVKKKRSITRLVGTGSNPGATVDLQYADMMDLSDKHRGLGRALAHYWGEGIEHILDAIDGWATTKSNFDGDAAYHRDGSTGDTVIAFHESILAPGAERDLTHAAHHEIGHAVDMRHNEDGEFSGLPQFNLRINTKGEVVGMHPRMQELVAYHKANPASRLGEVLGYPLDRTKNADMSADVTRQEIFAQLWAIYMNPAHQAELYNVLPEVAYMMEEFYATAQNTRYARPTAAAQGHRGAPQGGKSQAAVGQDGVSRGQLRFHSNQQAAKAVTTNTQLAEDLGRRVAGRTGAMVVTDTVHQLKKMVKSMAFLHDLVDEHAKVMPSVRKWYDGVQASIVTRRQLEGGAEEIAARAAKLKDNRKDAVNDFLSRSTYEQKWGYDPKFANADPKNPIVVDPQMRLAFKALVAEEQQIVRDVFAHGQKMLEAKRAIMKALGLSDELVGMGEVVGPYAPLKRFGDYVAVLKSKALRDAEAANDEAAVEKLKADPAHYVVSYFDTLGQARQFAEANDRSKGQGGKFDFSYSSAKRERVGEQMPMNYAVLQRVLATIKTGNLPAAERAKVEDMIRDMYFQSIDEHHANTSGLKRLNRAGYDADMLRSFLSHARAEANFLSNMKHGGEINEQFYKMQGEVMKDGKPENMDAFNAFAKHYALNMDYKETPIQDRLMAMTSAWQLATSIGYHTANALQGVMVTVPKLAADFNNYTGAWDALLDGYKVLKQTGVTGAADLSRVQDAGLRGALQRAADYGVLDVGMDEDLTQFEAMRTGIGAVDKASGVTKAALHKLRQVSRAVEMANRVASATAGYNMALARARAKPKAKGVSAEAAVKEAQDYAVKILQTTQGDFSRTGAPILLKQLPKVMTQYKKYQFMMAALYAKGFRDAFASSDPKVQAVGKRLLGFKLFHASMAAGALGLPLMNLVSIVFNLFAGGDDEPPDMERSLREWIGDETVADLVLHGPLHFLGMDAKLGEEKIFSVLPYADWNFSDKKGVMGMVAGLAGPSASQVLKMADGIGMIGQGDLYKGVEKLMPSGVANALKAARVANEGFSLRNGDIMFKPEDINTAALMADAIGLPSGEMKRMEWLRGQQYVIKQFYTEQAQDVKRSYAEAVKSGDTEAAGQAREDWEALQAGKDRMRKYFGDSNEELKRSPLSDLLKYPATQAKREKKLQKSAVLAD